MRRWLCVTMLCASCSATEGTATHDAGDALDRDALAEVGDAGGDVATDVGPACGAPPYVTFRVSVKELVATAAVFRLPGAKLSIEGCDTTVLTDSNGDAQLAASRGIAFTPRLDADGHVPIRFGERLVAIDDPVASLAVTALMPVTPDAPGLLEYGTDIPAFVITLQPRGTGTCADAVYTFITSNGVVHYMSDGWPGSLSEAIAPGGSIGPVVMVTGLPNNFDAAIGARKEHCAVTVDGGATHQTGRFHTSAGVLTVADVLIDSP